MKGKIAVVLLAILMLIIGYMLGMLFSGDKGGVEEVQEPLTTSEVVEDVVQDGWERYINEELGFSIDFPESHKLVGFKETRDGQYGGFIALDNAAEISATPDAYISWFSNQKINDFEQIDKRISRIDEEAITIHGENVRYMLKHTEVYPGVTGTCPIYYIQSGENAITLHLWECMAWESFDAVAQTVRRL